MSDETATGQQVDWQSGRWMHEPRTWQATADGGLRVHVEPHTDFWRLTHDGKVRHNGHFAGYPVSGNFTATIAVRGDFQSQYDQAGMMLLFDESHWLKTGFEYVDGIPRAAVVVTLEASDWSLTVAPNPERMWFRLARHGSTVEVSISADGLSFALFRQCTLPEDPARIGPFCAAPNDGFTATFESLTIATS